MKRGTTVARALSRPALALAVTAILFAALEGVCRLAGWGERRPVATYIADWSRQWDGEFYVLEPREGVNRDGLRDVEHETETDAGVHRLVFLGDSVTFGFKLPRGHSYPDFVRELLRDHEPPVEVFNVSLPGWSTRQQRIAYQRIVRPYRPDMVVVGFCLNDVAELQNNLSRPPRLLSWIYERSALVRALLRPEQREIQRVEDLFLTPDAPRIRSAWQRTFDELTALAREVAADGARLGLLVLPFRFQVEADEGEPTPQRELRAFAERRGLAYLDVLPHLRALSGGGFVDYDHLSPAGARAVAAAVARSGLVGVPPTGAAPQ